MSLGAKIKQARLEAGLSQRQLCGDTITRNMLSQIENGSANPSMETLRYLADRLHKSISFFLEETAASANQTLVMQARAAYASGDLAGALSLLEQYQQPDPVFDPEYSLLQTLILIRQAETDENPDAARKLLQQAADAGTKTPYYTPELERRRLLCLAQAAPECLTEISTILPIDDRELLLRAEAALKESKLPRCISLLEAAGDQTASRWLLLRGDAALQTGNTALAEQLYLQAEQISPEKAYPRLEQLYLRQENYKLAYYYACKQKNGVL